MTAAKKIHMRDDFQARLVNKRRDVIRPNLHRLNENERKFFDEIDDFLNIFGAEASLTVKQMNYLTSLADKIYKSIGFSL